MTFPATTLEDGLNVLRERDRFLCAGRGAGQSDDPAGYGQSTKNRRKNGSPRQVPSLWDTAKLRAVLLSNNTIAALIWTLEIETRAPLDDPCSPSAQQLSKKAVVKARSQAG